MFWQTKKRLTTSQQRADEAVRAIERCLGNTLSIVSTEHRKVNGYENCYYTNVVKIAAIGDPEITIHLRKFYDQWYATRGTYRVIREEQLNEENDGHYYYRKIVFSFTHGWNVITKQLCAAEAIIMSDKEDFSWVDDKGKFNYKLNNDKYRYRAALIMKEPNTCPCEYETFILPCSWFRCCEDNCNCCPLKSNNWDYYWPDWIKDQNEETILRPFDDFLVDVGLRTRSEY